MAETDQNWIASSQPAAMPVPPEVELLKLIVDYLPYATTAITEELLASVRLILADGPPAPTQSTVSTGSVDERCPDCGSEPGDSDIHREGCDRIGTCGQIGPPWIAKPWHSDVGRVHRDMHLREVHGV